MQTQSNVTHAGSNGLGTGQPLPPAVSKKDYGPSGVSREFHSILADIEDLLQQTTWLTGEDLARVQQKLNDRIAAARESIEEVGSAIAKQARKTAAATDDYVREQPWQAVGIGVGVGVSLGLLAGFLLARRA